MLSSVGELEPGVGPFFREPKPLKKSYSELELVNLFIARAGKTAKSGSQESESWSG